jgi:hypothetical protein
MSPDAQTFDIASGATVDSVAASSVGSAVPEDSAACTSARLHFIAACAALAIACCTIETGQGLAAVVGLGIDTGAAGVDMQDVPRRSLACRPPSRRISADAAAMRPDARASCPRSIHRARRPGARVSRRGGPQPARKRARPSNYCPRSPAYGGRARAPNVVPLRDREAPPNTLAAADYRCAPSSDSCRTSCRRHADRSPASNSRAHSEPERSSHIRLNHFRLGGTAVSKALSAWLHGTTRRPFREFRVASDLQRMVEGCTAPSARSKLYSRAIRQCSLSRVESGLT